MKPDPLLCDGCRKPFEADGPTAMCVVEDNEKCRTVQVCGSCILKMDPDMWINRAIWESINPAVSYDELPVSCVSVVSVEATRAAVPQGPLLEEPGRATGDPPIPAAGN